jgi:hypothetical protein
VGEFNMKRIIKLEEQMSMFIEEIEKDTAKDICALIDDLETRFYSNTSLEIWKLFKHIRNDIRDKYKI